MNANQNDEEAKEKLEAAAQLEQERIERERVIEE